ncbi:unnamed protein product [Larinioides sclopetarius]|uniref:Ribosome-recycling factor, mitochondrial n=1 Tax=Larinioides sclopetarius TaxID=280406 RepID=A0AAV2ATQ4_9ARAC
MEHLWKLRLLKSMTRIIRMKSVHHLCSASYIPCVRTLHLGYMSTQLQTSLPAIIHVRNYAKKVQGKKGGKQKHVKLSDEEMAEVIDVAEYKTQLRAAVDKLKKNYVENLNLRWTGSNVGNLRVKLQDEEFALHELAHISRKNAQLVVLNMSEFPEVIKHVIQAINESGSEMNPQQEGTMIYLTIPKLSRDTREVLSKNAKIMCNKVKEEIRNLQNHYIKVAKSKTDLSEDLIYNATNEIMALSDKAMDELRVVLMTKQHDILGDNEGSL